MAAPPGRTSRPRSAFRRAVVPLVLAVALQVPGTEAAPARAGSVVDTTSGRVVHYDFRGITGTRVPDLSGRGNAGTLYGFGTPPATGPGSDGVRTALVFDRSRRQRVGVGTTDHTSPAPSLQLRRFTIAAWIRITEDDTSQQNWEIAEKALSYWFNVRNGNDSTADRSDSTDPHHVLRCGGRFGGGRLVQVTGSTVVPHGARNTTWAHAVCTYDGAVLRIYLDGVPEASRRVDLPLDRNTGALVVGANDKTQWAPDWFHNWWHGSIDDFRLYDRALTPTEVAALHAATR